MIPTTTNASGLICAYRLDGRGSALDLTGARPPAWPGPDDGILWLHFDQGHQGAARWLHEDSGLDIVTAEALLGSNPRPRTLILGNACLISLRGVGGSAAGIRSDPAAVGTTLSVQLWSDGQRLITCRDQQVSGIADLRRDLEHGRGPRSCGDFVAELADRLVDHMDQVIGDAEAETHRLGHAGARSDTGQLVGELAELRRRMMRLRRYLGPQRRALAVLAAAPIAWLEADDRARLRAVAEQTAEYAEGLDASLAITAVTQDELLQRSSERMERRIYALTLLTAFFMPLTFVTGLLGVNLAGIPSAESPTAFVVLCALLVLLIFLEVLILRWKRWL